MTTSVESLRHKIRELAEKHARGDVHDRAFQKQNEKLTLELCRSLVRDRLAAGETILAEHHVIQAHTKLAGSVLHESQQESISLLATERRLFQLRCKHMPWEPVLYAGPDGDQVEHVPFSRIRRTVVRRQIRIGEMIAGACIAAVALLFGSWLRVTGIALLGLGIAGVLHGLLIPTRWVEILTAGTPEEHFRIYALRKRSARKLRAVLSAHIIQAPLADRSPR